MRGEKFAMRVVLDLHNSMVGFVDEVPVVAYALRKRLLRFCSDRAI